MKTLICNRPGNFEYIDTQKPIILKDSAIIKIKRIGICGTDLHAYEGTQPYFSYPRILGHELSGELIDFDNAPGFSKGEAVTFIPYFFDNTCIACRSGKSNCCVNIKVFGVHIDGGMQEYIIIPSKYLIHGEELSYDELALVEPLAIGAHAVKQANIKQGEFVLVVGAGPIGLGTMELAKIAGANVIALDINENRLKFCKDNLGVYATIDAVTENVMERLAEITNVDMPTVVIDATGSLKAINNGINYLAHSGRYVLIGLQKAEFSFSHPEFHKREATLMSSRNATKEDFEHVIFSMKAGLINPKNYITHKVSFEDVKSSFDNWLNPQSGVIKAMVVMD